MSEETKIKYPKIGPGIWDQEPDSHEFEFAGLKCEMWRNGGGAWCGYVYLPVGHPYFKVEYGEIKAEVHGGLTYAEEVDGLWKIGFDCGHLYDVKPAYQHDRAFREPTASYRTFSYAKGETTSLAAQMDVAARKETK